MKFSFEEDKWSFLYKRETQLMLVLALFVGIFNFILQKNGWVALNIISAIIIGGALAKVLDPKRKYGGFISVGYLILRLFSTQTFSLNLLEPIYLILTILLLSDRSDRESRLAKAGLLFLVTLILSVWNKNSIYLLFFFISLYLNKGFALLFSEFLVDKMPDQTEQLTMMQEKNIPTHLISALAGGSAAFTILLLISKAQLTHSILKTIGFIFILVVYLMVVLIDREEVLTLVSFSLDAKAIAQNQFYFAGIVLILLFVTSMPSGNMLIYTAAMVSFIIYQPIHTIFLRKKE